MRLVRSVLLVVSILSAFAASRPASAQEIAAAELAAFRQELSAAWAAGDAEALANLFTEDAIYWTPLGNTLTGRAEIQAWLPGTFPTASLAIEPLHDEQVGENAFLVGNFVQSLTFEGRALEFRGGYTILAVRSGERVLIRRLISFPERKPVGPPPN